MKLCLASASPQRRDLLRQIGWEPKLYPVDIEERLPDYEDFLRKFAQAPLEHPEAKAERANAELRYAMESIAAAKLRAALAQYRPELLQNPSAATGELWLAADTLVAVRLESEFNGAASSPEVMAASDSRDSGSLGDCPEIGDSWGSWQLLGKAEDEEMAKNFLRLLSGKVQSVCTGLAYWLPPDWSPNQPFSEIPQGQNAKSKGIPTAIENCSKQNCSKQNSGEKIANSFIMQYSEISQVQFRKLSDAEIRDYIACGEWRGAAGVYRFQGRGRQLVACQSGSLENIVGLPLEFCTALHQRVQQLKGK